MDFREPNIEPAFSHFYYYYYYYFLQKLNKRKWYWPKVLVIKKSSLKVRKLAFLSRYFLYISEYEIKTHELP